MDFITEITSKLILLVLLTQLGKTFTTIERIKTEIQNDLEFGRSIHLVFTMNTLLNGRQFAKRLQKLEFEYGKGSVVIFACKYSGPYTHVKTLVELRGLCFDEETCPRVVVMCSNNYKFDDGLEFIAKLETNPTIIERVFTYHDELHKYISPKVREMIEAIHSMSKVKGIIALTATPKPIWQKKGFWSAIRMIHLDAFNEEDYAGVEDMDFQPVNDYFLDYKRPAPFDFDQLDKDVLGFIQHVLDTRPTILKAGARVFIPAHIRRAGHEEVKRLVFEKNPDAIVCILNGVKKALCYKAADGSEKEILLSAGGDDSEVCEHIAVEMYNNKFTNRPLVITGFLCVGMGQTLTHKLLGSFTAAILSHMDLSNDEIYQLFGRVTGRVKRWGDKYCKTTLYCPSVIQNRCKVMEACARNIATEYNGEVVTEEQYDETMYKMGESAQDAIDNLRAKKEVKAKRPPRPQPTCHATPFATLKDVNTFLTDTLKRPVNLKNFKDVDGWKLTTRLTAYYGKKMDELTADDRLTKEMYDKIKPGMNISTKEGVGQQYMVYPVYPSKESAKTEVGFYVRYLKSSS